MKESHLNYRYNGIPNSQWIDIHWSPIPVIHTIENMVFALFPDNVTKYSRYKGYWKGLFSHYGFNFCIYQNDSHSENIILFPNIFPGDYVSIAIKSLKDLPPEILIEEFTEICNRFIIQSIHGN